MKYFSPKKEEKEVISIRLPIELLHKVDASAASFDISRNEFINQCILYAIANLRSPNDPAAK